MNCLVIYVGYEVIRAKSRIKSRAPGVNVFDDMVNGVEVSFTNVHFDGSDGEAKALSASSKDDGRFQRVDKRRKFPGGRGVP